MWLKHNEEESSLKKSSQTRQKIPACSIADHGEEWKFYYEREVTKLEGFKSPKTGLINSSVNG